MLFNRARCHNSGCDAYDKTLQFSEAYLAKLWEGFERAREQRPEAP